MKRASMKRAREITSKLEDIESRLDTIKKNQENHPEFPVIINVYYQKNDSQYLVPGEEFIPMIMLHLQLKYEAEQKELLTELETL